MYIVKKRIIKVICNPSYCVELIFINPFSNVSNFAMKDDLIEVIHWNIMDEIFNLYSVAIFLLKEKGNEITNLILLKDFLL